MPLTCPRCGGDVENHPNHAPVSGTLLLCPYCDSTIYYQGGFCLSYETVTTLLEPTDAKGIVRRWFRENQPPVPAVESAQLKYLPFWVTTDQNGERQQTPAIALKTKTPCPVLADGQREAITPDTAKKKGWPSPAISLDKISKGKSIQEALLIWAPFYWVTYKVDHKPTGAWVDAVLGRVSLSPPVIPSSKFLDFLNLNPLGFAVMGLGCLLAILVAYFSPNIILSLIITLIIAAGGFLVIYCWGRK